MPWSDRIGHRLKLSDLHVFLTVAESGSMAKAARLLSVSQPVVSRAVNGLEHTLGLQLLERSRQGIIPTAYGRALIGRGRAAFDELRQGVKDMEFLADPTIGEVRIGSTVPLASSFVSALIDRFSRRFPRVVFQLNATDSEALLRELTVRNLDFLIARRFGRNDEEPAVFEQLYDDPYVVVAGAHHALARRRRIALGELVNEAWAMPPFDSLVGSTFAQAFRDSNLAVPHATVFCFSFEVRSSLLATGRYLSIVPQSVTRLPMKHPMLKILPVKLPTPDMPIGIVSLRDRILSPVALLAMETARRVAREFPRRPMHRKLK
jgi:DNA-binding transcriptional LysR family regulator